MVLALALLVIIYFNVFCLFFSYIGAPAQSAFGQPPATTTSSIFGGGGGFGSQPAAAPTGGMFGQQQQQPAFGASTGGGLFGQNKPGNLNLFIKENIF